jgi:hypothetical protein
MNQAINEYITVYDLILQCRVRGGTREVDIHILEK